MGQRYRGARGIGGVTDLCSGRRTSVWAFFPAVGAHFVQRQWADRSLSGWHQSAVPHHERTQQCTDGGGSASPADDGGECGRTTQAQLLRSAAGTAQDLLFSVDVDGGASDRFRESAV